METLRSFRGQPGVSGMSRMRIAVGLIATLELLGMGCEVASEQAARGLMSTAGTAEVNEAVRQGDRERVKRLVAQGAPVTPRNRFGVAPLHEAVFKGDLDMAQLLLSVGAEVNFRRFDGSTALHTAVGSAHLSMVKLLIERGADVNSHGGDYASPLWHSMLRPSGRDKLAVAALLIQHGADTHYRHPKAIYAHCQTTPLHVAVFTLNFEAVNLLLANGADLRARDLQGRTPLACAQEHEQVHKGTDTPQIKKMIDLLSGYERALQR